LHGGVIEGGWRAAANLPRALLAEIDRRSRRRRLADVPQLLNVKSFTRSKVEPMVRGLFPAGEQEAVLALVERSVVLVTRDNLARLFQAFSFRLLTVVTNGKARAGCCSASVR